MSLLRGSKKLKPKKSWFHEKDECVLCEPKDKIKKILWNIEKWFYNKVILPIRLRWEYHQRVQAYKPLLKEDRDWDSQFIYPLLQFKMERIYKALKNGVAIHEKKDMDALKECIKVLKRLHKDTYDDKYFRAHDKKWGKLKTKTIKEEGTENEPGGPYYRWEASRSKAKTKKQQQQERKDFRKCWENGAKDREADVDRLFELMKNHMNAWWD